MRNILKPLNDYVVVELAKQEDKTESGLFLPNSKGDKAQQKGEVIAVGPGRYTPDGSKRLPMTIKKGETVLLNWGGTEIEMNRVKLRVLREDDIIAVID